MEALTALSPTNSSLFPSVKVIPMLAQLMLANSLFIFTSNSCIHEGDPEKIVAKCLHGGSSCKVSRRRLLSASIALGATILTVGPVLPAPLKETKDPEVIRYQKLSNGVKFQDIIEGVGPVAHEGDLVEFNYVCRRSNGYFVHSTVDQFSGESSPVILLLDEKEIIQGLKDVLVGMKVGGKRRALIPPNVGYVNENLKPIPDEFGPRRSLLSHAKEPLIFEIQLLKVL